MKFQNSSRGSNNGQGGQTGQKQFQGRTKQKKQPNGQYGSGNGVRGTSSQKRKQTRQMKPLKKVEKEVLQYIVGQD